MIEVTCDDKVRIERSMDVGGARLVVDGAAVLAALDPDTVGTTEPSRQERRLTVV